jgi:16S rRNA (cytidine1402-2'-O)-methyltransferase
MPGTLFVVATPIGNLEDISARALRILREVSLIAAEDTRRTAHLLARYAIQTPTTSLNEHNETGKSSALLTKLVAGESVALVSDAGTPTVSDPGEQLIRVAIAAGIRVEPIPGASAVLAMLAVCGLPSETFTFLGFPPTKSSDRKTWFEALAGEPRTVVFFESPHRLRTTLEQISSYFGDCHIVVGRELTKVHEEVYRGSVSQALSRFPVAMGEFCLAINLAIQQKTGPIGEVSDGDILKAFHSIQETGSSSKRRRIQDVARRLGVTPNRVYGVVEQAKTSGN